MNKVDMIARIKYNKSMNDTLKKMTDDLAALIAVPSVAAPPAPDAPFGAENRRALDAFLRLSRSLGLKTGSDGGYAGWAEYGEGKLITGVLAHLDVVPAGDGWTTPPFELDIREGVMYGRGVSDDKGPLVAALYALARLSKEHVRLNGRVRLIAGCNEEEGSACIKHYAAHCELPRVSFTPDSDFPVTASEKGILQAEITLPRCEETATRLLSLIGGTRPNIVPEKCRATLIVRGEKTEIEKTGKAAHGSTPEKGVNAVTAMLGELAGELTEDEGLKKAATLFGGDAVCELGLGKADETGRTTINIGMARLSGGRITLTADMRLAATYSPAVAINALSLALGDGAEIKTLHYAPPLVHDENGKLVRTLMNVYRECTGDTTSRPLHIGGGTYAKELPGCIAFGAVFPGRDTRMHDSDECYPLSDFEKLTEICYRAVIALDREFAAE